ncbi:hypothetical protein CCACVL1_30301 [Corchorus capsularis]|uniref:Replication protein A 70 kDa DNA-binding subunit B/D first OB fold domain-containing protein n=1 Tax=Corchorus capsularis TaxID=210143 RepID=A0A1R3FY23_COCAP|nr:hypothetical protein CCACVL1_30301 [Corchorus capsularis]
MALTLSDKDSVNLIHARLSQLRPSLRAYVIARVARKWETILPAQTQPINGDLLLVDDMGASMEVVIPGDCMHRFSDEKVAEGKVYKILHFQVSNRKKKYKSIPGEYTIYFLSSTKLIEVTEDLHMYPRYFFRFAQMADIITRSEKDPVFTDAIGMFIVYGEPVGVPVDSGVRIFHKVDVDIRLLSDEILRLSFWVSHIQHLNLAELAAMSEKPILEVAATTVRSYSSTKYLCSSSSTKVYVNPDIKEARETPVALLTSDQASQSAASANAKDATILQLLYLDLNKVQGQKFRVEAEITEFDTTNGWYYECYSDCPFKVHPAEGGVFFCTQHKLVTPRLVDQTLKRGWLKFKVYAYTEKQARQAIPTALKGKQIIGSASERQLPATLALPQPLPLLDDSQTCPDSPSIPADLFVETSLLKKIKQEPTPDGHSRDQDQPDSDSQLHQDIPEKINQESATEEQTEKLDNSHSHTQTQHRTVPRGAKDKQV